jgi:hypothetical protein
MANSKDAEERAQQASVPRIGKVPSRTNIEVSGPVTPPQPPANTAGVDRREVNASGRRGSD